MSQATSLVVRRESELRRITPAIDPIASQLRFQQRNSRQWRYQLERALLDNASPRLGQFLDIQA